MIDVDGDLFYKVKNSLSTVIQVSRGPEVQNWSEKKFQYVSVGSCTCYRPVYIRLLLSSYSEDKWCLFRSLWDFGADRDLDYIPKLYEVISVCFLGVFYVLNKSPYTKAVQKNAATQFFCEAPEMFCGLWHLPDFPPKWLWVDYVWIFTFWMNLVKKYHS